MQLVDIKKFFDKERLTTIMTSLSRVGVNKKAYKCWYKLNKKKPNFVWRPQQGLQVQQKQKIWCLRGQEELPGPVGWTLAWV